MKTMQNKQRGAQLALFASIVVVTAVAAGAGCWFGTHQGPGNRTAARSASTASVTAEARRQSGAVARFRVGLDAGRRVGVAGPFPLDSAANLVGALTRIAATGREGQLMTAQAADPHAGHKLPAAPAPAVHKAEGVVRSVGEEVVIKHGPIPTLGMGAMTMTYKAPKGGLPKDVTPGTNVRFEFVVTPQGDMQLMSIVPGGRGGA